MRDRLLPLQDIVDEETWDLIEAISDQRDLPFIIDKTLSTLENSFRVTGYIGESNQIALCNMIKMFWNSCMYESLDMKNALNLVDYTRVEQYEMAIVGKSVRLATANEVASGTRGLQMEYMYPVGEAAFRRLTVFCWAVTGRMEYFKRLGYKVVYNGKELETSFYQMVSMAAYDLMDLFKWANTIAFSNLYKELRKVKKVWKHGRFLEFAEDEVIESITPSDLIFQLDKILPRGSSDPDYRKAISIIIRSIKYEKQPTPMELEFLRRIYDRITKIGVEKIEEERENKLKSECEFLLAAKDKGYLRSTEFVFRIIETLSRMEYKRCSPKQHDIIVAATQKAIAEEKKSLEETQEKIARDNDNRLDSVIDIMDSLGNGVLEG